jgi:hypothetical protein
MNIVKSFIGFAAGFIVASSSQALEAAELEATGCFPLCKWEQHAKAEFGFSHFSNVAAIPTLSEVTDTKLRHGGIHGGLWPEFKYRTQWEPFPILPSKCEGMGCLTELLRHHGASRLPLR